MQRSRYNPKRGEILAQKLLIKRTTKNSPSIEKHVSSDNSVADLRAATENMVPSLQIYLRVGTERIRTRVNFSSGLDEREFYEAELSIDDVGHLYEVINNQMQSLRQDGDSENLRISLAREGWHLYKKLISDEDRLSIASIHKEYLTEQSVLGADKIFRPVSVLVKSNGVTVPWEFLYIEDPWDGTGYSCDERYFMGYWAQVQQDITTARRNIPRLQVFGQDGLKIFFDHNLDIARDQEVPGLEALFAAKGLSAHVAEPLRKGESADAFLTEIQSRTGSIVHLACHSENQGGGNDGTFIRVNDNYLVEGHELRTSSIKIGGEPFLFINSCEMAVISPRQFSSFLNYFFDRGFCAVLATEIEITDQAAWDFSQRVYSDFLGGTESSLCFSVFSARRRFLADYDSLIGFTYSYYGLADVICDQTGKGKDSD